MLSYMLPPGGEDKPPAGPPPATHSTSNGNGRLQLAFAGAPSVNLANGRGSTPLSKETSVSSFASDVTTATHSSMTPTSNASEKGKPKLIVNGGKHPLKRVSFGSSKGSMVETLIFESPVQEEPESSPIPENGDINPFPEDQDQTEAEREKVRVKFFQQSKPQEVDLPNDHDPFSDPADFSMMATQVIMNETNHVVYNRTESTESGWDNPFRPGGDLSREADEIVELIKGGKPITPTPGAQSPPLPAAGDAVDANGRAANFAEPKISPKKATDLNRSQNGNVAAKNETAGNKGAPGAVDVQRGNVKPECDASQVEHVTIKKKPKCKCCVIQ